MSDFQTVAGFEDVWRPPVRPRRRTPEEVLGSGESAVRARLVRLVNRTPEVMVKVTGRTRDPGQLLAHLDYITRHGDLEAEDRDGVMLSGRDDVRALALDWSAAAMSDPRWRANSPVSLSIVLSMPAATDAVAMRDAARSFARETFGERFDYAFVLHTDTGHPHVHLAVRALGDDGRRLNPKKADLTEWREGFARALRDRGVEAEATPRRARGVTRKSERAPVRKIGERYAAGHGPIAEVRRGAYRDAARAAFQGETAPTPWEAQMLRRQAQVRALYLAQAGLLKMSADSADRALGQAVERFVRDMPAPDSQRLALARDLRASNRALAPERSEDGGGKERSR
ncbi:relaxase/mobilization nuclease domain-containing protein [Phenylobacterium sp.]|uniref:relaxase/mobilization nuclease domain-containing protein n=1 Tax=Phenylobacterium sp. TaxID=1871053 RepID=UPI003568E3D5